MSPTIEKGDIVIIKIGEQVQEKDIITYKKQDAFITHRIIEINGNSIVAKGDNNNTQDEAIQNDAIIGKVVFIFNNVEVWKKVFSDMNVIIPIVITVILFIILVSYNEKKEPEQNYVKKEPEQNYSTGEKND